jgi:hypothetical protein
MQSAWDKSSFYIHLSDKSQDNSLNLTFPQLLRISRASSDKDKFIFHAQSSLVYLVTLKLLGVLSRDQIIYDIHDLNVIQEKLNYMRLRGISMHILEFVTLKIMRISSITVSSGLAIIIAKRFKSKRPLVVRNISAEMREGSMKKEVDQNKMVYFGTFDRLPNKFFVELEREGLQLDIYGRFNNGKASQTMQDALEQGVIKYCGEYNPGDMGFLRNYAYLYYNIDPYDVNYRFAGPNKFFQALVYGLVILTPQGYSELSFLLKDIPGAQTTIKGDIVNLTNRKPVFDEDYSSRVESLLAKLKTDSQENYRTLIPYE